MKAIKSYGQHFLHNELIAKQITDAIDDNNSFENIIEIGPGPGILTKFLFPRFKDKLILIEIDKRMIPSLEGRFPGVRIINADFLHTDLADICKTPSLIIGNFPYNISSQILFRVLDHKNLITEVIGMFQREVARRVVSEHGSKEYGILTILMRTYFDSEWLIDVPPAEFRPPPKVQSAVIRLKRNEINELPCDEKLFKQVVKQGFNQRRKVLRNSLKSFTKGMDWEILLKRPEQLSLQEFYELTNKIASI